MQRGLSLVANLCSSVERSYADILQDSAAALFAQVPEGLLPTVTISLMIASDQMAARNVIVRRIDAVETLGCVTVFCPDKTGILTTGEMTVQDFAVAADEDIGASGLRTVRRGENGLWPREQIAPDERVQLLAECGILNNAAPIKGEAEFNDLKSQPVGGSRQWLETRKAEGSPTEVAILRAGFEAAGDPNKMQSIKSGKPEFWSIPFGETSTKLACSSNMLCWRETSA